ncbi:hypothetical protein G6F70_001154 [Rhizopus microsporus]|uniref:THIF-type NAD/FAD binding fold domain-containing protein n=2 Tax=Rhizopus TaxID=4842 RepID=A0A1X0SCX5_RHIZD|nr:hypothetical protein G6F71_000988 [Rhizopus microsporus]KAG1203703.1 hypothetical protein G6F70_001154 [Rhizopus microsporus]KAG1215316.1 hypothetical protein G6F69_001135 [Rhizopus microsporus]KAG1237861.1 hypothetical protein G6F67_000872 [Rhizopus microsporus]KAG1269037.1 hypothetical protein G6F68_000596 [Rhizopus microsporus]
MLEQTTTSISNFLNKHQHGARITLTALSASVLTAMAILGYQKITRRHLRTEETKERRSSIISLINDEYEEKEPLDETLVLEFLARNIAFLGEEGVLKIRNSFVIVVGNGAIGSYTSLMLVRSGIQHIRIIDKDVIRLRSLTCHAVAKVADVGKKKVDTMKKHLAHIAPNATIEPVCETLGPDNMDSLLSGQPDFVVDTLSSVKDKVLLAKYCKEHNIKIISSISAHGKADPSQIQLTDISSSAQDPLARMYRRQLRKYKIDRGIPVVYSIEKSLNFDKVPDFTKRSLPVFGPIASMFGMSLTTYVILQLAGFTAYELPETKGRDGVYSRIQKEVARKEEAVYGNKTEILDVDDIGYIFEELWQGKSAFSDTLDRALVMTRWDRSKPCSYTNTILVTKQEAKDHEALPAETDLHAHYGPIAEYVEKQFNLEKKVQQLWESCQ